METGGSFPVGTAARAEAEHSRLSSAEIKNEWSYTSSLRTPLKGVDGGKFTLNIHRINRLYNIHSKNCIICTLNEMNLLATLKNEKVVSVRAMKAYGGAELELHPFLTSTLDGGGWATVRPGKGPPVPIDGKLVGPQRRSGRFGEDKNLLPMQSQ